MPCDTCKDQQKSPVNKFNECEDCHKQRLALIGNSIAGQLAERILKWFKAAEKRVGVSIFYTDDLERMSADKKSQVPLNPQTIRTQVQRVHDRTANISVKEKLSEQLTLISQREIDATPLTYSDLGFDAAKLVKQNGCADGFLATGKRFQFVYGQKPSQAVKTFIKGRFTVCECEGMVRAVIYNAICDAVGDAVFDVAFAGLVIDSGPGADLPSYIRTTIKKENVGGVKESECLVGDWVLVAHNTLSGQAFRSAVENSGKGGNATEWNMVCAKVDAVNGNEYIGFGLSDNRDQLSVTLDNVKEKMIKACGGDPENPVWGLRIHFRRWVDRQRFTDWLDKQLRT